MTYREDQETRKLEYLGEIKRKINDIYVKNNKLLKSEIAKIGGMSQTEFSRFLNDPVIGLSDERLKKLEDWIGENS